MKSLLRNLMFVARRYRLSVVLNLLGLTAAFMVLNALLNALSAAEPAVAAG